MAASQVTSKLENTKIRDEGRVVSDITTSNATPTLAYTTDVIPTNTTVLIEVRFLSANSGFTLCRNGFLLGSAIRASGNVAVQSTPISNLIGALVIGGVMLVANTTNQTVEVYVTGILATTVNWRLAIYTLTYK